MPMMCLPIYSHRNKIFEVFFPRRNPLIRYLYAIISFPLKNVRIALLRMYFSPVKQGIQTIDMRAF